MQSIDNWWNNNRHVLGDRVVSKKSEKILNVLKFGEKRKKPAIFQAFASVFPEKVLPIATLEHKAKVEKLVAEHGPNVDKPEPIVTINAVARREWEAAKDDPDAARATHFYRDHGYRESDAGGDDGEGLVTPYDIAWYGDSPMSVTGVLMFLK
jgi:hypothetical protein